MFALGFAAGIVVGTAFGWIVCAVITHDMKVREEHAIKDAYYIEENDM